MEQSQETEMQRPADLERYEQRQAQSEELEAMEPPYEAEQPAGVTVGVDAEAQRLLDVTSGEEEVQERTRETELFTQQLARLEARNEPSPDRASQAHMSELSVKSATSVHERKEPSEPELLSAQVADNADGRGQEEAVPSAALLPSPPMEQMIQQLGALVQQALREQVTPALTNLMLQQARVESRLETLETRSRATSSDGEALLERARLLSLADQQAPAQSAEQGNESAAVSSRRQHVHTVQQDVHTVQRGVHTVQDSSWANLGPNGVPQQISDYWGSSSQLASGGNQRLLDSTGVGPQTPLSAWQASAGGMRFVPYEAPTAPPGLFNPDRDRRQESEGLSAVLHQRARSPFERVAHARSEPGAAQVGNVQERRTLRPATIEPGPYPGEMPRIPSPLRGQAAAEQLAARSSSVEGIKVQGARGSPKRSSPDTERDPVRADPKDRRQVTPVRPRIVYPISPGGTEIRPPPVQCSPKKAARSTPSPPKPKPPEPASDIQKLTAALETAFKSRVSENRVEDVKTIPELPKLEVKDHEKELMPLIAGDWLTVIGPSLRDLSAQASQWWSEALSTAQDYYAKWLASGPVDRLLMKPEAATRFDTGPFVRVEQRAVSLLLKAVPSHIRDEVVTSRRLTTIDIIGTILTTFQPGGLRERSALLKFLTSPEAAKNVSEALKGVRRWSRWTQRANELHVAMPDATLLIGGLDLLTATAISQHPEAHFRLQTFRHQSNVDHVPTQEKAMSLGKMLQAELQVLENAGPAKRNKVARIVDDESGNPPSSGGKGDPKGKGGYRKGGKDGKTGDAGSDGKACYHWMSKSGCRLGKSCRFLHSKAALTSAADASSRCFVCSGLGHRAAECPTNKGPNPNAQASSDPDKDKSGKGTGKSGDKAPTLKRVEEESTLAGEQAKLLTVATSLLEQMQAKALMERVELHRVNSQGERTGLIDSGASTCLRRAQGEEPVGLVKRVVDLAQGSVELYSTPCGTLVSLEEVEAIVALGPLIRLGCRLQWGETECLLYHPKKGRIKLMIDSGCPRVSETLALELIGEIEQYRMNTVGAAVRAIQAHERGTLPSPKQAITVLTEAILTGSEVPVRMGEAILALWPSTPKGILQDFMNWVKVDSESLVYNRRKRRAVNKASKLLLHLCAGDSRKEIERLGEQYGYEVISVGEGEDLCSPQTYGYLLGLAAEGRVDATWGAPPCGTNTLCRFFPPGPRPIRGRDGSQRWGLKDLSEAEAAAVKRADELYLRVLLLMHVASEGKRKLNCPEPWALLENPQDPEEYVDPKSEVWQRARELGGFPSFYATDEFKVSAELLSMRKHSGDQGPYGHAKRKPTTWASTKPLPPLKRGPGSGIDDQERLPGTWKSAQWAKWAPGMIKLLGELLASNEHDKLAKSEINWEEHLRNGHWPPSRRCRVCIAASARQRPHHKVPNPASWVLAADTIGPFKKAEDETSNNLRYLLVACLLIPVDQTGKPVLGLDQEQAADVQKSDEGKDKNPEEPHEPEWKPPDDDPYWESIREALEELDDVKALDGDERAAEKCEADAQGMSLAEKACSIPGLRWRELIFVEPMRRKTPASAEQALNKVITEAHEMGFPVVRLHSDSGSEFVSSQVRRMVTKFGMKQTCSAPEEHNSNGRIENVVRRIKNQVRVHLQGKGYDVSVWPLAARAAAATWRTQVLRSMGFPAAQIVPFGTSVQVLARTWRRRSDEQAWTLRAVSALVMCPASLVKLGYVVRIGKRLSVVTRLFEGQEPPLQTSLCADGSDPPLAHSIGPETRIGSKSTRPDMSHIPPPSRRYRYKSPGPGRVPISCRLQVHHEASEEEDRRAHEIARTKPLDMRRATEFIKGSSYTLQHDNMQEQRYDIGKHYLFGACNNGQGMGMSRYCKQRPGMCALLTAVAQTYCPENAFSAVSLSVNTVACPFVKAPVNVTCQRIDLQQPAEGGRVWSETTTGDTMQGEPAMVETAQGLRIGQLQKLPQAQATVCNAVDYCCESWSSDRDVVTVFVGHMVDPKTISRNLQVALHRHGFVLTTVCDKGGDPKPDLSPNFASSSYQLQSHGISHAAGPGEQGSTSSSHQLQSNGISHAAGPGEQGSASSSHQLQSNGISHAAGPGEHGSASSSHQLQSNGISHAAGPGEQNTIISSNRDQFCRICETSGSVSMQGVCQECGCLVCVPSNSEGHQIRASDGESKPINPKSPKNSINPKRKQCSDLNQDGCAGRVVHGLSGIGCDSSVPGEVGGWAEIPVMSCAMMSRLGKDRVYITLRDHGSSDPRHESGACVTASHESEHGERSVKLGAEDAEGPGEGLEDAEASSIGYEELLFGTELEHEVGVESCRDESLRAIEDDLPRHELVDCEVTEQLRVLNSCDASPTVRQREIEAFAAWLDERQLRLSSAHEQELQAWLNDEPAVSEMESQSRMRLQKIWQDVEDLRFELKALASQQMSEDIVGVLENSEGSVGSTEVVLQTRIVSNAEVMTKWELWEPSTKVEIDGLVTDKEALEVSTQRVLDQLQARGTKVTLIPSKVIYSLKAPCGRRKCRLVACGNFLSSLEDSKQAHKHVVYTASIGIESLRTALAFSVRRGHSILTIDIKAAFLNAQLLPRDRKEAVEAVNLDQKGSIEAVGSSQAPAPVEASDSTEKEIVALIPPRMLITKGVFQANTRLVVRKAVYGLDQSPRDWAFLRDSKLPKLVIQWQGREFRMFQSYAEDSLWLVMHQEPKRGYEATSAEEPSSEVAGWAAVYVDDILIAAPEGLAHSIAHAIRGCWECSEPQQVGKDPNNLVRFLGMDLSFDEVGNLHLSQEAYVRDLGRRYEAELKGLGKPSVPMSALLEEDQAEEHQTPDQIKRAQGLVGELLWASIRTRPDASYAVSRLAAQISKAPKATYRAGLHTLAYLLGTADVKLTYYKQGREIWKEFKRHPDPSGLIVRKVQRLYLAE